MRTLAAIPLLLAASCSGSGHAPETAPVAGAAAAPAADQAGELRGRGVGDAPPSVPSLKPAAVSASQSMEKVDVFVDLKDPNSGRALASYLMKPEEWTILSCVQTTPTSKHWRFQRVMTPEKEKLDRIDPLRNPRR